MSETAASRVVFGMSHRKPRRTRTNTPPTKHNAAPEPCISSIMAPWTDAEYAEVAERTRRRAMERIFISMTTHLDEVDWPAWVVEEYARRLEARLA